MSPRPYVTRAKNESILRASKTGAHQSRLTGAASTASRRRVGRGRPHKRAQARCLRLPSRSRRLRPTRRTPATNADGLQGRQTASSVTSAAWACIFSASTPQWRHLGNGSARPASFVLMMLPRRRIMKNGSRPTSFETLLEKLEPTRTVGPCILVVSSSPLQGTMRKPKRGRRKARWLGLA